MLLRLILILSFFLLITIQVISQPSKGDASSNYEIGNYEIALQQYLRLLKTDKLNSDFQYRIGVCYLRTNLDKKEALPYLKFAEKDPKSAPAISFELGKAYFYSNNFDTAMIYYNKYLSIPALPDSEKVKVDRFIDYIKNAKELMKRPLNVTLVNLGEDINSKRADYNPFVTIDESYLFFGSNRKYISDFQQLVNGVYMSKGTSGGRWQKAKSLGSKINTDEDISLMGMDKEGEVLYVQPESYSYFQDLYYVSKQRGRFKEVMGLGKDINTKNIESGASITTSGDTLYFASNRPGGFGGMDIYFSKKLPNGEWGIPQNIGPEINTSYDENMPDISRDSKKLFFCSNGYNSMGGYDIFYSKLEDDGKWGQPKNFGYPVNDFNDNYNISITGNGRYGYTALSRSDGLGDLDIYKVIFNTIEQVEVFYKGTIAAGDSLHSKPLKEINPDITISVLTKENQELFGSYSYNQNNGKYIISLPPGKYELVVEGDKYETYHKDIEVYEGVYNEREFELNIWLKQKP